MKTAENVPDWNAYAACAVCPRECLADRLNGSGGFCRSGSGYEIASISLHRGEEPALDAGKGICNVFFSHCNLQCVYCQNYQISRNDSPVKRVDIDSVISAAGKTFAPGVECLGFVSPSHAIIQMKEIIIGLRNAGIKPTIVMNTNGYDKRETIESLSGMVDVYLPDFKYMDRDLARCYSRAEDYPDVAIKALREMYRQKGPEIIYKKSGAIESGLIVRHLILPGHAENSKECLRAIAEELSPAVTVSLMSQYYPVPAVKDHPNLGRPITKDEYAEVVEELYRLGFHRGWIQEMGSHSSYRPDFSKERPFTL